MTTDTTISDPHQKALAINLDTARYGTFAEIGAGQEVSRWFFRVGGAAGTIAKSISAYDMKVSDVTYGQTAQYVSRDRLIGMLDHEHAECVDTLNEDRGDKPHFLPLLIPWRPPAFVSTILVLGRQRLANELKN